MVPRSILISLRSSLRATFSPATLALLQEATKTDPDPKIISKILKLDPALAANVLALTNSPYYGQTAKIADLPRAILILGINEILRLALSLSFHNSLDKILKQNGFDVLSNWRLIIWSALGAELIAQHIAPDQKNAAYLCTLIKDLALLIYAATFPDHFLPLTRQPGLNHELLYTAWHNHLPTEHASLTAELLSEWNFPESMIAAITAHHDLEQVLDHPPLTQAVILGTRWAEVEFRTDPEPGTLNELGFLLDRVGALPKYNLDHLRQRCATLFESLCASMSIVELPHKDRLYAHTLHTIQNFYYQTKEVENITGGLGAVASCVAKHLYWNWNITDADIELYASNGDSYQVFSIKNGQSLSKEQAPRAGLLANPSTSFTLTANNKCLGTIHILQPCKADCDQAEVDVYVRLLAKCFERYQQTIGQLELKAALLDILPIGIMLLDAQGNIIRTNDRFLHYLRKAISPGTNFKNTLQCNGLGDSYTGWQNFLESSQVSHCIAYCPLGPSSASRSDQCFTLSSHKIKTPEGLLIPVLAQDLSEVRFLEFEALGQRDFLAHLLATMQDLALTVDQSGLITFASGQHGPYLQGKNLFHIARPLQGHVDSWDMAHLAQSNMAIEVNLDLDNEQLVLELIFSKFSHGNDYGLIVARNTSNIRRLEQKIKEQALFDALTQVFNRHHLEPTLEREILRSRRTGTTLGMIFFDIDRFKEFNDRHGHHNGDNALRDLGKIIRNMIRAGQDYPCRFGGDEFVIIVNDTDKNGLHNIAQRLQQEFRQQYNNKVSLSIGTSLLEPEDTVQSLLRRCDQANYQAKDQGGFCIVHLQSKS